MPRKPRIQYPGALCHMMSRGGLWEYIFRDNPAGLRLNM